MHLCSAFNRRTTNAPGVDYDDCRIIHRLIYTHELVQSAFIKESNWIWVAFFQPKYASNPCSSCILRLWRNCIYCVRWFALPQLRPDIYNCSRNVPTVAEVKVISLSLKVNAALKYDVVNFLVSFLPLQQRCNALSLWIYRCRITHSHGSARSVLKATKQVNGKGQNSTPRHTKTP